MSGTRINGKIPVDDADVVVYSYQAVKNLPTADSGMICFKDKELDTILRKKTWLGINKDTYARSDDSGSYKWRYDVEYVGQKYHGNSIMAAIALAQLKILDKDNAYRKQISEWYMEGLKDLGEKVRFVEIPMNVESSRHLFQIIVDDRDKLMTYLNNHDIYPGVHYISNTNYRMYNYAKNTCKYADFVSEHVLSLPLHMRLTYDDVKTVIEVIKKYYSLIK
jgi:dTDP-4-amino-4,6-dideoxygalactose transaminase